MSNPKKGSQDVQQELYNQNNQVSSGNELIFDPTTGEMVVAKSAEEVGLDATVASDIARDGFAILPDK